MALQIENSTHICSLKLTQNLAHVNLHIIEIKVKWLQPQCCLLNTCFFMLFMDVPWNSQLEIDSSTFGIWLYFLPHFMWIISVTYLYHWSVVETNFEIAFMYCGHYLITVCGEEIWQLGNWGSCLKLWWEKCTIRAKIFFFFFFRTFHDF